MNYEDSEEDISKEYKKMMNNIHKYSRQIFKEINGKLVSVKPEEEIDDINKYVYFPFTDIENFKKFITERKKDDNYDIKLTEYRNLNIVCPVCLIKIKYIHSFQHVLRYHFLIQQFVYWENLKEEIERISCCILSERLLANKRLLNELKLEYIITKIIYGKKDFELFDAKISKLKF